MKSFFMRYLGLVAKGVTIKEFTSRREACQTYQIKDSRLESLTTGQKVKNVLKLVTRMKTYKSNVPSYY